MKQPAMRAAQGRCAPKRPLKPRRSSVEIGPYAGLGLADASSYHLLGAAFSNRRQEVALTRHQVAHIIGVDPKTAARRLARFEMVGLAERITIGSKGRGLAGQWVLKLRAELSLKKGNLPFSVKITNPSILPAKSSRLTPKQALPREWQAVLELLNGYGRLNADTTRKLLSGGLSPEETLLTVHGAAAEASQTRNPLAWLMTLLTTGDLGARFRRPASPPEESVTLPTEAMALEQAGASRVRLAKTLPELQCLYGPALGEAVSAALRLVDTRPNVQARGAYAFHLLHKAPEKISRAIRFARESKMRRNLEVQEQQGAGRSIRPPAIGGDGGELWKDLRSALAHQLTPLAFDAWIESCVPVFFNGSALHLSAPTRSAMTWIQEQFTEEIHDALCKIGRSGVEIVWRAEWNT